MSNEKQEALKSSLYFYHIPPQMFKQQIFKFCEKFGRVESVNALINKTKDENVFWFYCLIIIKEQGTYGALVSFTRSTSAEKTKNELQDKPIMGSDMKIA